MPAPSTTLNLFSFTGRTRILHLGWMAFFLTFVVWFNHAPLLASIKETMGLSDQQIKALLILNVAITIPARIIIGMVVDKFGPRITYTVLLIVSSIICFFFAFAETYEALALGRFLLGFVGAGFVIGIRLIGEWFPAKQMGIAEGIYGGFGNFGSAGAALSLPLLTLLFGGGEGWRYSVAITGAVIFLYAFVFYFAVTDTPKGSTYFKPNKTGGLEVTSKGDFLLYLVMNIPLYVALAVLAWKLETLGMLNAMVVASIYALLVCVYLYQSFRIYQVNAEIFKKPVPEIHRYPLRQVAVLGLAYFVAFGAEIAVVSMLPLFFKDTFEITQVQAGLIASSFPVMCLCARPIGGTVSDRFGRKFTLSLLLAGLALGFLAMSQITGEWPILLAVLATTSCAFFVLGGAGAVFAMVPLIKRRLTGQIAGMVGAYGNVGGVVFLTVLSFVSPQVFFLVIAGAALVAVGIVALFLREPQGTMVEVLPDGTVHMIELS
jgi:NNP family nitrate/nitrite transporter-like MFS transporter